MYARMHACMHARMQACMHTRMDARTNTHTTPCKVSDLACNVRAHVSVHVRARVNHLCALASHCFFEKQFSSFFSPHAEHALPAPPGPSSMISARGRGDRDVRARRVFRPLAL